MVRHIFTVNPNLVTERHEAHHTTTEEPRFCFYLTCLAFALSVGRWRLDCIMACPESSQNLPSSFFFRCTGVRETVVDNFPF